MVNQKRKFVTLDGTVYIHTGESFRPEYSKDKMNHFPGQLHQVKVLHRTEGNAWIWEKMEIFKGRLIAKEYERATDEEAKQVLIDMMEVDALLKYGLGKLHGADTDTEERISRNKKVAGDKQTQRVPAEWITKLGRVRDELMNLTGKKDNDPEQRKILENCIKEIQAVEKLLACERMQSYWWMPIKRTLQNILRIAQDVGARVLANKINEFLNQLPN